MKQNNLLTRMLLLFALIVGSTSVWAQSDFSATYTSNVPLTTTDGTKAELCKVIISETEYDGIKIGTGSAVGACKITVPQNTKYLHMHVAGWNGVTNLSLEVSGIEPAPEDIPVTADTGVKNSSPFTLDGTPSSDDYYTVIEFEDALDSETTLTFTTSGKKRCVIFGVNAEENTSSSTDPALTVNPSSATTFTYEVGEGPSDDQMFEVTGSNLTDDEITASITGDFEMTDDTTYGTTDLTLASGDVVSVRLKAGLAKGEYDGTLTFASTDATDVVINLSGTVTKTDPSISADDVNLAYNATSGSIAYTIAHGVEGGVLTAALTETSTWLTVGTVGSSAVALTTTANKGDVRSAVVRLTYTYDTNETVTKDVTVTQASPLEDAWVLTDLANTTTDDVFVIVGNNGKTYAMSNDKGTSAAPTAVAVTVENDQLTGTIPTTIQWQRTGTASSGYTFHSITTYTNKLYCTSSNNGVRVGSGDANTFSISEEGYLYNKGQERYLGIYDSQDWRCYTSINSNITGQTFAFYKKIQVTSVTVPATGFSTYVNADCALDFTGTGITPYVIKANDVNSVALEAKTSVAAGEPVLLYADGGATKKVPVIASADAASGNLLVAGDGTSVTYTDDNHYYVLATVDNVTGFYRASNNPVPEGKAYLDAGTAAGARFFALDLNGETTGIAEIEKMRNVGNDTFYNLAGQRVAQPTRGLYIMNGRKIVVK